MTKPPLVQSSRTFSPSPPHHIFDGQITGSSSAMDQAVRVDIAGQPLEPLAVLATKNHSIDLDQPGRSCLPKQVTELNHKNNNNNNNKKYNSPTAVVSEGLGNRKNGSCVIPGVEHVFFEKELEKMEHTVQDGQVVVMAADCSVPSEIAFKFFVEHVNRPGYVLHVVHHSNYWGHLDSSDAGPSPKHCQDLMAKEDTRVKEVEEKYKKLMGDNKVTGEFVVLRGKDAWHDIIQYQEKVSGIMIVMGTRGQNSLRRTFMGSVSDSVVHHASCPVLVCCHPK